jgi:hypothetical protein
MMKTSRLSPVNGLASRATPRQRRYVGLALIAAHLFGASAPLAKLLLRDAPPQLLVSGIGLTLVRPVGGVRPRGALRRLEQLDRISRWILEQDLLAADTRDDVVWMLSSTRDPCRYPRPAIAM